MGKKQKTIVFVITGLGLAIILASIAGYYIRQGRINEAALQEGKKYADDYLAKYLIRCGNDVYVSGTNNMLFQGKLLRIDNLIQVELVDVLVAPSNESLTVVEQKEGIDWKGRILFINGKSREYDFTAKKWKNWDAKDNLRVESLLGSALYRIKGVWTQQSMSNLERDMTRGVFPSYGVAPKPIDCAGIPK